MGNVQKNFFQMHKKGKTGSYQDNGAGEIREKQVSSPKQDGCDGNPPVPDLRKLTPPR
jgi:hypothetical protein